MDIDYFNKSELGSLTAGHFVSSGESMDQESFLMDSDQIEEMLILSQKYLCQNETYENLYICKTNISEFTGKQHGSFEYALLVSVVVPIIFGIVVLVGVFGNTLVVIVIIVNKQMKSTTNYLIFSLAIADLLFTVFCVPFTASDYIFSEWPFGTVWCKIVQYLTYVTAYASVYTLLLLSIDRYFAVVHPIYAMRIRTDKNAMCVIIFTWSLILSSCIPLYIVHGTSDESKCTFLEYQYNHAAFHIGFITTMYFIPLCVIVGLYLMILHRLWTQSAPGGTRSAESVRGKKRVTRMVVIVIVTFMICWLPIQIVLLLKSLGMYEMTTTNIFIQISGHVLAYMNSCINPILYAFLSDPFRKAFRKVMSCGPNHGRENGHVFNTYRETRPLHPRQSIALSAVEYSPTVVRGGNKYVITEDCPPNKFLSPEPITNTTSFMTNNSNCQRSRENDNSNGVI